MAFKQTRIDDSRAMVRAAFAMSYGSYIEQEGKKGDQWRDQTLGQLVGHLEHELEEVKGNLRRGEIGYLLHNAMDVCELGAIILAWANDHLAKKSDG